MDLLEQKITMFGYITSRPHLTMQEKLILLNFVKEASKNQLNYLLSKGRMLTEKELLQEADEELEKALDKKVEPEHSPGKPDKVLKPEDMTAADRETAAQNALHRVQAKKGYERAINRQAERGQSKALEKGKAGEEGSDQPSKVDQDEPQAEEKPETKPEAEEKVKAGEEGAGGQPKTQGQEASIQNKARDTAVAVGKKAKEVAGQAYEKGSQVAGQAYEKGSQVAGQVAQKAKEVGAVAQQKGTELATQTGEKAGQAAQWASQNPGQAAGIAALGAAGITAGVLAYKRFFSKAARACSGLSGAAKTQCIGKYKVQGKKAEIATLNAKKAACKGNPKCIGKIQARIQKAGAEAQSIAAGG